MRAALLDQNTRAHSPNLGDIRWLGAKSVMLLCQSCQHQHVANINLLPDDVPLALIASKFVCSKCHQNRAHALPHWDAAAPESSTESEDQQAEGSDDKAPDGLSVDEKLVTR